MNVFCPGWHPFKIDGTGNGMIEPLLNLLGKNINNLTLCTLPSPIRKKHINADFCKQFHDLDYEEILSETSQKFTFWGNLPAANENLHALLEYVTERNQLIRKVAKQLNLPLLDWAKYMAECELTEYGEDFYDVCHPRPRAYPKIARIMQPHLNEILRKV